VAAVLAGLLGLASLAALILVLTAPVTSDAANYNIHVPISSQYKEILVRNGSIVTLTIILNIYGTLALVGGAIYSGFLFWRKRVLINRVLGNILIAAGALAPAMAGSFVKAGLPDLLYVSELIGVIVMYLGFVQATVRAVPSESGAVRNEAIR
jgi:vacuolar-type H+-ATPase subunit I/STV1